MSGRKPCGQGELGHELVAVRGDELAVGVNLEGPVARIGVGAVVGHRSEEPVSLDRYVGVVLGVLQRALLEVALGGRELDAVAHLYGYGHDGVLGGGGARHAGGLVDEVLEVGPHLLEARSIDVGEVVGDRVDARLLSDHAARGGPKATDHLLYYYRVPVGS